MFYIILCFYSILLFAVQPAYGLERWNLSDDLTLRIGAEFSHALQFDKGHTDLSGMPIQGFDNSPVSSMANTYKYFSLYSTLNKRQIGLIRFRMDYLWNKPTNVGLYQKSFETNKLLLRDLYLKVPFTKSEINIWAGIRTFEFTPISIFDLPNPFDQVNLQGAGIEGKNIQISLSINQDSVKTISTTTINSPISGKTIETIDVDASGNPILSEINEYIITLFLSGKLLLPEGRLFEPIFSFRYYMGGSYDTSSESPNHQVYRAKAASGMMIGGIFSRPISNGISGVTTVWFSTMPAADNTNTLPVNNSYSGTDRVSTNIPKNTIGIMDSSEFYFTQESALFTGFYATNNTYSYDLPILKSSGDGANLQPDPYATSRSNNIINLGLEPNFLLTKNFIVGGDIDINYISEKLFQEDANGVIFSPFLKWAFDDKINTKKYVFTSLSFGIYDWQVKKFSDNSRTNTLISLQMGGKIQL